MTSDFRPKICTASAEVVILHLQRGSRPTKARREAQAALRFMKQKREAATRQHELAAE